ncbi:MAG: methyl-accepting chemotaxis protein [Desulfovibrionales bacterium]|nr:methyl-accepting chemotaxis protein [Desulfovibrionales bacterium]
MQFRSLKAKMLTLLLVSFVLLIGALLTISLYFTRMDAVNNARTITERIATEQVLLIKEQFNAGFHYARALRDVLVTSKTSETPQTRKQMTQHMYEMLKANKSFFGVWTVWEADAFDANDTLFTNAPEHSSPDGRFVPYWNRSGGQLSLRACGSLNGAWYTYSRDTREEKASVISTFPEPDGSLNHVSSLTVPVIVDGKALGVAGVDLSANFLNEIVNGVTEFKGTSRMALIAANGQVQASTGMPDVLGTQYEELVKGGNALFTRAQNGEVVISETDELLRVLVPARFGESKLPWVISLSVPMDIIMEQADSLATTLLVTGIIGLLLATALLYWIATLISRPVVATSGVLKKIAEGDLNARCIPTGHDEIATMQRAVNSTAETLQTNIVDIQQHMEEANALSEEARVATRQAEKAQQEAISAHKEGRIGAASQLKVLVDNLNRVSGELTEQVNVTAEGVGQQDARNSETATAMEEMNSTILEVARNASEAAGSVDDVNVEAHSGLKIVEQSVSTIKNVYSLSEHLQKEMSELGIQVESISEILNVITDIADQTNLLALNAAIEAARAGDAGRGFAVVADEVRKLAENTMEATSRVGKAIQTIQSGTQQNISAMTDTAEAVEEAKKFVTESGDAFGRIVQKITPATDQVRAIATAAEQQSAASEEITHALEEINQISSLTHSKMEEAERSMFSLGEVSTSMTDMMEELQKG